MHTTFSYVLIIKLMMTHTLTHAHTHTDTHTGHTHIQDAHKTLFIDLLLTDYDYKTVHFIQNILNNAHYF